MKRAAAIAIAVSASALACGARPPPPPPKVTSSLPAPNVTRGELDGRALLADLPSRAARFGAGPLSIATASEAYEGERVGAFVDVPQDACLLGYARASSSVEDLDLAVFSDEGTPLAVDEGPDSHPAVLLCPPHPSRVYVAAHTASGEGLVVVGVHLVPPDRAPNVARVLGARGGTGEGPRPADAWPGLDDQVRAHRDALGGRWEEIRKVAVSVDSRAPTVVAFPLEGDQCTDAVVVPSDEVALLDVEALDESGRVVARAHEGARARTLTLCSSVGIAATLAIRPHVGRGLAAVVLSRARGEVAHDLATRPDVAWTTPASTLDQAKRARNDELSKRGYDAVRATMTGTLALGRRVTVPIDPKAMPASGCARIDVIGGAPLALVSASVWTDAGGLVASDEASGGVTLFACGKSPARVELETRGRPGPFAVVVRAEKWSDASFTATPLAAARMLARAADGPSMLLEGAPSGARAATVDASHRSAWDETIAAGKCLRVVAGAEGEGTGLELRVFDASSQAEIDRSHGARAAGIRACAPADSPRAVHLELRATSGKLNVVVGERTAP